jgi:hypothetical protein
MDEIERLIKSARPPLSKRAEDDLAAILAGTYQRQTIPQTETAPTDIQMGVRRKRWPVRALAAAAVVAVTVLVSGIVLSQPSAAASTPYMLKLTPTDLNTAKLLQELAGKARMQPDTGSRQIVEHTWALATDMGEDNVKSSEIFSEKVVIDVGDKGCIRQRRYAETLFDKSGNPVNDPEAPPPGTLLEDRDCSGDGQLFPSPPPEDPAQVAGYLINAWGGSTVKESTSDAISVISEALLQEHVLNPAQEAALLEFCASLPDLEALGSAVDRLSRQVWVFAAPFQQEHQFRILIDADTGHIVGDERIYQGSSRPDLPSPAVVQYTAFEK